MRDGGSLPPDRVETGVLVAVTAHLPSLVFGRREPGGGWRGRRRPDAGDRTKKLRCEILIINCPRDSADIRLHPPDSRGDCISEIKSLFLPSARESGSWVKREGEMYGKRSAKPARWGREKGTVHSLPPPPSPPLFPKRQVRRSIAVKFGFTVLEASSAFADAKIRNIMVLK